MVLVQKRPFFQTFFFLQYRPAKCLLRYFTKKNSFLGYKNKEFKKSKNWHFSKGVNPWFRSNNGYFSKLFFLGNIGQDNVFYDILQRKNSFLGFKRKKMKKSKNWHFYKGVTQWFLSRNDHYSNHFFRQCRQGKCLSRYSSPQKSLSRLSKQEVQKVEKLTFFQRG